MDETLLKDLSALAGVKQASLAPQPAKAEGEPETKGQIVKIECMNSQQALVSVVSYLGSHNLTITALETLEPNLESVFLHLTGKSLRD